MQAAQATLRQRPPQGAAYFRVSDASRTGYAEAKVLLLGVVAQLAGCKPHRLRWGKVDAARQDREHPGCKPHRLLCKAKANVCRKAGNI